MPARRWQRLAIGAVLFLGTAPVVLHGQEQSPVGQQAAASAATVPSLEGGLSAAVDLGLSRIDYNGYLPSGVLDLSPMVRYDATRAVVVARGTVSRFESGNTNTQVTVTGGGFTARSGGFRGELAGAFSAGHHESIGSTGDVLVTGRVHLADDDEGAWLGVGQGWSALGGGMGAGVAEYELGGWLRRNVGGDHWIRATASLRHSRAGGLRYSEVGGALRWAGARFEAGADAGVRSGDRAVGSGPENSWLSGDAAFWVDRRWAVTASAGRFLADPTVGAIGGRYASIGLRLALRRPPRNEIPRVILPRTLGIAGDRGSLTSTESLVVEEHTRGRVVLRFTLPGAREAAIMGDFTGWEPLELRRASDGRWEVTLLLTAGVHRVNLRTDDGPWRAPPGLTVVDDGFGGEVGLLLVGR